VRFFGRSDADTELALGLKVVERSAVSASSTVGGMQTTIGLIIACAGVGVVAIAVWFWLTDPERHAAREDPEREALYDRAAWVCFVMGLCAVGLGLFLALTG
jgi:uncharacterized membrane protein YidH (DUF202 family)